MRRASRAESISYPVEECPQGHLSEEMILDQQLMGLLFGFPCYVRDKNGKGERVLEISDASPAQS